MTRTIAHFTDCHLGQRLMMATELNGSKMSYARQAGEHEDHLRAVLDDIRRRDISEVVFGGDIGTGDTVPGFFEILGNYDLDITVILGNHDRYDEVLPYCRNTAFAIEGRMCFSRGTPSAKWIYLDSSENEVSEDQLAWLGRELEGVRRLALFVHHPVLAIDTPVDRTGAALRGRDKLASLLNRAPCEVSLFTGHYHMADEAQQANIRQYCTPAVSYQIARQADHLAVETKSFGYRILEFDEAGTRTQTVLMHG